MIKGKVCIIGAGCSGLSMAKRLKDEGIDYDQFDSSDNVGGNWYHNNPNGMSACYQSLHIDTSKWRLAFEEFPVPSDWPDFPHHSLINQYLNDYTDHFGLRDKIAFNTAVEDAARQPDGSWDVTLSTGETRNYAALIVANGHHWDAKIPTEYPGEFTGIQMHSHSYDSPFAPHDLIGMRVMVVGVGNSAMDIASELSQRPIAERLVVSARRGVWVLPKYINGAPADKAGLPPWMPERFGRWLARKMIIRAVGRPEDYGLPKPDHEILTAHPSVSAEFLNRLGSGDIIVRPAIDRFDGNKVIFADGTEEELDAIIWATGYRISFPFFKSNELSVEKNRFPLYKRMIKPGYDNLFFVGLAQSLPTLLNLGEQQSKYIAAVLSGKFKLPSDEVMERKIVEDEQRDIGHYYDSERHTIQVDFVKYVNGLKKELKAGGVRLD